MRNKPNVEVPLVHVYRYQSFIFHSSIFREIFDGCFYETVEQVQEPLISPFHYRSVAFDRRYRYFGIARP